MLNRNFDDTIVMQIVYLPEPRKQESVLLIASQSRLGPTTPATAQLRREAGGKLTGQQPIRNSSTTRPGRSQQRHRAIFILLAKLYCIKALPKQASTVVITGEALS
jgi:hypothetical protein